MQAVARSKVLRPIAAMHVLLALFSGLGLAFVLASGPLVQAIVVAFFSGHTSSLYDGENVGQLVNAETYIEAAVWPLYLAAGLISAIAMVQASTKKSVLACGTIAIGTSLTVIDAFAVSTEGMAVSVLCNFAAGFLLATFTLTLALNSKVVRHLSSGSLRIERVLWILWPFVGYLMLASILFFVLSFLTTIPATPASFRLEPSLNGYYVTSESETCKESRTQDKSQRRCELTSNGTNKERNRTRDAFAVLGKFKSVDKGNVEFIGGGDGLTFEWTKGVASPVTGSLWITQGCVKKDHIREAMKSKPIFRGELRSLRIALDEGLSEFRVLGPKLQEFEVVDDNIAQFWVNPLGEDTDRLEVSRFLGKGVIRTSDRFDAATYELAFFPLNGNEKGSVYQSRRITYAVNGADSENLDISMESKLVSPNATITCEPLPTRAVEDGLSASASTPYVSLVISIDPPKLINLEEANRSNHVTVSGANGWIKSSGYRKADLHEAILGGSLSQLSLLGVVKDLVIDGHAVSTGETSTLQLSGKLEGRTDGPAILMEGNVDYLILNGKRLTTTRWEQLDAGVRIPVILGVPTAAYFLLNFVISTLRRRARKVWRLPGRSPVKKTTG